jgi:hypothetical protein
MVVRQIIPLQLDLRDSYDRVERCANLMRHCGEEIAFTLVSLLGFCSGVFQIVKRTAQ